MVVRNLEACSCAQMLQVVPSALQLLDIFVDVSFIAAVQLPLTKPLKHLQVLYGPSDVRKRRTDIVVCFTLERMKCLRSFAHSSFAEVASIRLWTLANSKLILTDNCAIRSKPVSAVKAEE